MRQNDAQLRQAGISLQHRLDHALSAPVIPDAKRVEGIALHRVDFHQSWPTMQRGLSCRRETDQRISRHRSSIVVSTLSAFLSPLPVASTPR